MSSNKQPVPANRKPRINVLDIQGVPIESNGDWTKVLQEALKEYYVVYLPAGIYKLAGSLYLYPQNKLVGDGLGNTVLQCTAIAPKGYAISNYVDGTESDVKKKSCEIEIRDITISGATLIEGERANCGGVSLTSGAEYSGKPQFILDNVRITGFTGIGLFLDAMESAVSNVNVGLCNNHGIYLTNVANRFIGCTSHSNFFTGFYVATGGNFLIGCKAFMNGRAYRYPKDNPDRSLVVDNNERVIDYAYDGFYITGSTVNIASCSSQQNYRDGIRILGNNNTVDNTQLFANNCDNENGNQLNGCSLSIGGSFNRVTGFSKTHNDYWNGAEKATVQILCPEAHDNVVDLITEPDCMEALNILSKKSKEIVPLYVPFWQQHVNPFNNVKINGVEMVPSIDMHDLLTETEMVSVAPSGYLSKRGRYEVKDDALHVILDKTDITNPNLFDPASMKAGEAAGVLYTLKFTSRKDELYLQYDCKMDEYDAEFCAAVRIDGWYYNTASDNEIKWDYIYLIPNGNPFSNEIHKNIGISLKDKYVAGDTVDRLYIRFQFMLVKLKAETENKKHSGVFKNIRFHLE